MNQMQQIENKVDFLIIMVKALMEENKITVTSNMEQNMNDMIRPKVLSIISEVTGLYNSCLNKHGLTKFILLDKPFSQKNVNKIETQIRETWNIGIIISMDSTIDNIVSHVRDAVLIKNRMF